MKIKKSRVVVFYLCLVLLIASVYGIIDIITQTYSPTLPETYTYLTPGTEYLFIRVPLYADVLNITTVINAPGYINDSSSDIFSDLAYIWSFEQSSINHTKEEITGLNGSVYGSSFVNNASCARGNCYFFGGNVGHFVNFTNLTLSNNFTISLYSDLGAGNNYLIGNLQPPLSNYVFYGTNEIQIRYDSNNLETTAPLATLQRGVQHFAYTYNGSHTGFYKNGTFFSYSATNWDETFTLKYMGNVNDNTVPLLGSIDEVYIWKRALNTTEIAEIYNKFANGFSFDRINVRIANSSFNKTYLVNGSMLELNATDLNLGLDCDCINCTIDGDYCILPIRFHSDNEGALTIESLNITYEYGLDDCTDYSFNILDYYYFDQEDNANISATNSYDLNVLTPFTQAVNGSFTGTYKNSLCSNINLTDRGVSPTIYGTNTLSMDEYATQIFETPLATPLVLTNAPTTTQNFYLRRLNESSTIVFTWLTTDYQVVDGTMYIYECLGNGSRRYIESPPIIDGTASANLDLVNTPYSYEVDYEDTLYTDESSYTKCHVETDTTRQYFINTGTDVSPTIGLYSIPCNLSKSNFTITMEWGTNPESTADITGCIFAERISVAGTDLVYSNCSITENPLIRNVPDSGFTYNVYGRLYQGGYSINCKDGIQIATEPKVGRHLGIAGLFAIVLFIIGMILLFSNESPLWYPIMAGVSLVLSFVLGFVAFGIVTLAALVFFLIIIVIVGRHSKAT